MFLFCGTPHFVPPFLCWYVGCLHFGDVAVNIHIQVTVWAYVFPSLHIYLGMELLGGNGDTTYNFLRNSYSFPEQLNIPTMFSYPTQRCVWGFQFPHILLNAYFPFFFFLINCHPNGCEVSHCDFLKSNLYMQHGVQTDDPEIKSQMLYWLGQPGAPHCDFD